MQTKNLLYHELVTFSLPKLLLILSFLITPVVSNASDKNKTKKSATWQTDFTRHIAYDRHNKELLHASFVLLEVSIDEKGMVTIENYNGNKPEAVAYIVKKLNGLKLKNETSNDKFIVKYCFK